MRATPTDVPVVGSVFKQRLETELENREIRFQVSNSITVMLLAHAISEQINESDCKLHYVGL